MEFSPERAIQLPGIGSALDIERAKRLLERTDLCAHCRSPPTPREHPGLRRPQFSAARLGFTGPGGCRAQTLGGKDDSVRPFQARNLDEVELETRPKSQDWRWHGRPVGSAGGCLTVAVVRPAAADMGPVKGSPEVLEGVRERHP